MPRALISVTDKTGVVEFAQNLSQIGFELISTGGTAKALRQAGLLVREVSEVTGFPEMLDGRVKTLHPLVHGGLLGDRRLPNHVDAMREAGIIGIDLLCVNLYAFEKTVTSEHTLDEAIESIDIGGPAMIRAAAKNHANLIVVVDPKDYSWVSDLVDSKVDESARLKLAAKAFRHTAYYDSMIARYLTDRSGVDPMTETLTLGLKHDGAQLRYGENPHQAAARYIDPLHASSSLRQPENATGKEISYNNWLDAEAAWELVSDLPLGASAIIKHGNPCGVAIGRNLGESYRMARASDPISAFGGIVAFNGKIDRTAVEAMTEKGNFLEVVIGQGWEDSTSFDEFMSGSPWTKNVRFLEAPAERPRASFSVRSLRGAFLVQGADIDDNGEKWRVATNRQPSESEWKALRLMWSIVPHVKSNAIVVGKEDRMLGVGAGQMNRVQSVRLALEQAGEGAVGSALASDAFFPFPDSIETAAKAGIAAIIQPGGSKKDDDVIAAANDFGIAMVLTGTRHFRH